MNFAMRIATALWVVFIAALFGAQISTGQTSTEEMRRMRREARNRPRRIIFNNDSCDSVHYDIEPTAEALLSVRTAPILGMTGSQVDALFYCTNRGTFARHSHNSKAGETFLSTDGRFEDNVVPALIEKGTDPLRIMVNYCKKHDTEIFWSERMIDTHDASRPENLSQWKKDHPELLVGSKDNRPPHGPWSSVDYAHQEVRDKMYAIFEDVITRYDVDGVEMDFFRHPTFFASEAWNGRATQQDMEKMTALVRRIRKLCDRIGEKRGKAILLATRIQDSGQYRRRLGLDLQRWLEEGLIDIVAPSGYFRLQPWETAIELGHKYDGKVYPCLSESRIGGGRKRRNQLAGYRARAMNAHAAGADGIYMFNYFNSDSALWRQVGSVDTLRGKRKRYFVTYRGPRRAGHWLENGEKFNNLPTLCPDRPMSLKPGDSGETRIRIEEEFAAAQAAGYEPSLTLELEVEDLAKDDALSVTFNGDELDGGDRHVEWVSFSLTVEDISRGWNPVQLKLNEDAESGVKITDLLVQVEYDRTGQ